MLIMGVDLALNKIGLVFYETTKKDWSDVFLMSKKKNRSRRSYLMDSLKGISRFTAIAEFLSGMISAKDPDIIVMEDFSFGSMGRAVFDIGQLNGIVRLEFKERGFYEENGNFILVSPSEVKKAASGRGNAAKVEVMMAVCKKTKINFVEDFGAEAEDVCDAIGVVMAYLVRLKKSGLKLECNEPEN